MIYVYAFLLTGLYLANSQIGLPSLVVFGVSALLYVFAFMREKRKYSQLVTAISMMIISLPFSWNPMWGATVGASIITWYYLWTSLAIILLFMKKSNNISIFQRNMAIISLLLILYSAIPLIMSQSIVEGIKEFLMIGFFLLILLGTSIATKFSTDKENSHLIDLYIFVNFLMGLGMLIQFLVYRILGIGLFGFKEMYSYGGEIQTGCHLLMDDASSGTIMLGVGAMLALINRKRSKFYIFELFTIIIGMACSGRRTGALVLVFVMGTYYVVGIPSLQGKIKSIAGFGVLSTVLMYFMSSSRAITTTAQMFNNNGRFKLWSESLVLFLKSPILGYGFDNVYLEKSLMPSKMIVHNTALRWLNMGGLFFGLPMIALLCIFIFYLRKCKRKDYMWSVLYAMTAAMLIPDILNARFFYAIALMAMLSTRGFTEKTNLIVMKGAT